MTSSRWIAIPIRWVQTLIELALLRLFEGAGIAALVAARSGVWRDELTGDVGLRGIE